MCSSVDVIHTRLTILWHHSVSADFSFPLKVKMSPKSNQGFICDWIWVKPSCKCIITKKEALLRFIVVSFSGKLIFDGVQGHSYASIKIAISIPECDLTSRLEERSTITLLPVRSHSGIDTFCLPWWQHAGDPALMVSVSKSFFLVNSTYTNNVLNARVHVWRPWRYYEQSASAPCTPLKISLPENETTVNFKSASFTAIMQLHDGLTHIQSQIKPRLLSGESFTLSVMKRTFIVTENFISSQARGPLPRRWGLTVCLTAAHVYLLNLWRHHMFDRRKEEGKTERWIKRGVKRESQWKSRLYTGSPGKHSLLNRLLLGPL